MEFLSSILTSQTSFPGEISACVANFLFQASHHCWGVSPRNDVWQVCGTSAEIFPDTNEQLRSSLGGMVFVLARKLSCTEWAPFHLSFRESCLFHILAPMPSLYAGETGRNLRSRFSEHLRRIRNNTPGSPVPQHFNSTGHSISDVQVRGMVWRYAVVLTFNESNVRCGWLFN